MGISTNCHCAVVTHSTTDQQCMSNKIDVLNKSLRKLAKEEDILIADNSNIDTACLSTRKLHLNRKDISTLACNFINFLDNILAQNAIPSKVFPNYVQNSQDENWIRLDKPYEPSDCIESQIVTRMEAAADCFEVMKTLKLKYLQKVMSEQVPQYFVGILSPLLSGFRHG